LNTVLARAFAVRLLPLALALAAGSLASSCTVPPADGRYVQTALPDASTFPPVAELLSVRCGSIDCHGTPARNLRVYGSTGLRWLPGDRPFYPVCNTPEEDTQTYDSVVGLEPEAMSAVVAGGAPSLLTLVNKARGTEAHKGGQIWTTGDDSDVCLTSWLQGRPDPEDCKSGVESALPMLPTGGLEPLLCCFESHPSVCQ
jgi:hypothetical protein